jgi:hypothetical protein
LRNISFGERGVRVCALPARGAGAGGLSFATGAAQAGKADHLFGDARLKRVFHM